MRALFFDWPEDPAVWEHPLQYMLGNALLVAPVVEPGATTWPVYLPAGRWIDAWDGSVHIGPVTIERVVPLTVIPVYIRADASDARILGSFLGLTQA